MKPSGEAARLEEDLMTTIRLGARNGIERKTMARRAEASDERSEER